MIQTSARLLPNASLCKFVNNVPTAMTVGSFHRSNTAKSSNKSEIQTMKEANGDQSLSFWSWNTPAVRKRNVF